MLAAVSVITDDGAGAASGDCAPVPTVMIAVPRIFEKIYAGILNQVETSATRTRRLTCTDPVTRSWLISDSPANRGERT